MLENFQFILGTYFPVFLEGVKITLLLAFVTVCIGTLFGILVSFIRMSRLKALSIVAVTYIEIIRGTPLLLQLYLFYFLVPQMLPWSPSKFVCVVTALIINSSAYVAEIIRSGIQAVDSGQAEAALSLGLTKAQAMRKVILPQAVRNILPALGNEFITNIKETSLASTFFLGDIMTSYRTVNSATYLTLEPLIIAGCIYFVLTFTLSKLVSLWERRLKGNA